MDGGAGGGLFSMVLPLAVMMGIWYMLVLLPQRKRDQKRRELLASLKKGDEVVLSGGLFGKIWAIEEATIVVEIADKTRVKMQRASVVEMAHRVLQGANQGDSKAGEGNDAVATAGPNKKSKKKN